MHCVEPYRWADEPRQKKKKEKKTAFNNANDGQPNKKLAFLFS